MAQIASMAGDDNRWSARAESAYVWMKNDMAIAQVEEVQAQLANLEKEMSSPTKQLLAASDILLQKWKTRKTLQTIEFDETEESDCPTRIQQTTGEVEQPFRNH